jgi:hypothetical protein
MEKQHTIHSNITTILDLFLLTIFTCGGHLLAALVISPTALRGIESGNVLYASLLASFSLYILFSPQFYLLSARKRMAVVVVMAFLVGIVLPYTILLASSII